MLKFILILTCFWLVECRFMHPYYGKDNLRHSRKYYYSLNKPPPDFDPIHNYAKDDQRAQFQCPEDDRKCSCPFQYRDTAQYECYHDAECPENYKCCPDSCYVHEICKAIVTKTGTERTTTAQRPATEKYTTITQTEETTPEITTTERTTLVTIEATTEGSTTTENQRTEETSEVTSPPKTGTTLTVLRTTTDEITREPIPEPKFVPEETRAESTTQIYVGTTPKIVSTTGIKGKPTKVSLSEPEVIEADESGSGTFDNDDDEDRDGRISTISTITSEVGTNSDIIFDDSKTDFETIPTKHGKSETQVTISAFGVGTTQKLTESTSSQYGKDLVYDTEKPKIEFVSELTQLESTTEQIEDNSSTVLGTSEIKVTPKPTPEPEIIEASGSGDGTIENDDEDEETRYTKDSTVEKTTPFAAKTVPSTNEIKKKQTQEPIQQPEVIEASGSGDGTTDDDEESTDAKDPTIKKSTPSVSQNEGNSDDIIFDNSDRNFDRIPTKDGFNQTTLVPITITRDHTESTSNQHGKDLASDKSATTAPPHAITTEGAEIGESTAFVPILTQLESTTETSDDKISTVLSINEIKEKQTQEPIQQPEVIEASGSGDGTTDDDDDEDEESTDEKDPTIKKSTPSVSQTDGNSNGIIFDNSDRNFEKISTKDGNAETTTVSTDNTSAIEVGTTRKHVESTSNKDLTPNIDEPKTEFLPEATKLENTTIPTVPGTTGIKEEPTLEPAPQPEVIDVSGSGDGTTSDDEDEEKRDTTDSTIKKNPPLPSQTTGNSDDIIFDNSDSNFEEITKSGNKTRLTVGTTSATEAGTTQKYTESIPKETKPDVSDTEDKSKSEFLPEVTKLESTTETIEVKTSIEAGTADIKDKPKLEPIPQPEIIEASGSGDVTTYDDDDDDDDEIPAISSTIEESTRATIKAGGSSDDIIFDETTRIAGGTTVAAVVTTTVLTYSQTTKVPTRISVGTTGAEEASIGTKVPIETPLLTTILPSRSGQADNGTDKMILPQPTSNKNRKEVEETVRNQDKQMIDEVSGDGDDDDEGGGDDEDFGSGALLDTDKSNLTPGNKEIHEEEQKNNAATMSATEADQRTKDDRMKRNQLDKRTHAETAKTRDALDELGGFFVPDYEILD